MLRHHGDGFSNGGSTSRAGAPITAAAVRPSIEARAADGLHVERVNREGGFPVRSRGALMLAIDACTDELGRAATRRLLIQAARAMR